MMQSTRDNKALYDVDIGARSNLAEARERSELGSNNASGRVLTTWKYPSRDEEIANWESEVTPVEPTCGRRKRIVTILTLAGFVLFIVVIAVAVAVRNNTGSAPVATNTTDVTSATSPPADNSGVASAPVSTVSSDAFETTVAVTDEAGAPNTTLAPTNASETDALATTLPPTNDPCVGYRIGADIQLNTGKYICSTNRQHRFGMDDTGSLIYTNDVLNKTLDILNGTKGDYFRLLTEGNFTVFDEEGKKLWEEPCSETVKFTEDCIIEHGQTYDCPSIHLHDTGTLILNWIEDDGPVEHRSVLHLYKLGQCDRETFFCEDEK